MLGKDAFKGNKLEEVVLKDEIKELGKDAFAHSDGDSKPLPTFKVSKPKVMKLVFSQFITKDKVLPVGIY